MNLASTQSRTVSAVEFELMHKRRTSASQAARIDGVTSGGSLNSAATACVANDIKASAAIFVGFISFVSQIIESKNGLSNRLKQLNDGDSVNCDSATRAKQLFAPGARRAKMGESDESAATTNFEDTTMGKEQKSTKEKRKPKADKKPAASSSPSPFSSVTATQKSGSGGKKK